MTFANTHQNQKRADADSRRTAGERWQERWRNLDGWTMRLQFVCCGKKKCGRCKGTAYAHGPYWYGFLHTGGRMRSRYVGKAPQSRRTDTRDQAHRESRGPVSSGGGGPGPRAPRFVFDGKMTMTAALRIMAFESTPRFGELKSRWRTLIQDHHPDRGGDGRVAAAINAAYTFLKPHVR